jgi:hypothetical protein
MDPITLLPDTHRCFNQLATAQAATAAYIIGHTVQAGATRPAFTTDGPISQVCFTRPEELEFEPSETLGPISQQVWPSIIHLKFHPGFTVVNPHRPPGTPQPSAVQLLMGSLYEHAFITYYEKNVADMIVKYGTKRSFPGALAFGRVVRNAFAHGGTINITDGLSARWSWISYSDADNGRRVLYNDLSSGDLTLLMIEMDSQF